MSNPGLAFLYQTTTILRPRSVKRASLYCRALSRSAPLCERRRPGRPLSLDRAAQADVEPGFNPNSTLTPTEDRKFRAIFEAAAKGLPPPSIQKRKHDVEEKEHDEYKPGDSIDALFEKIGAERQSTAADATENRSDAVPGQNRPHDLHKQPTVRHVLRELSPDFPASLQGAWRDARRAMAADARSGSLASAEQKVIQHQMAATADNNMTLEKKSADIARIQDALDRAVTDFEVWAVLESEVFPRVRELVGSIGVQARREDGGSSKKSRRAKKAPKGAQKSVNTTAQATSDIVKSTYPIHLLNAMRKFRMAFPYSPYALAFVQAVKQLGPVSQVLGLSTELYNELLFILWRQHSNIFECANTVEDMNAQGLIGDQHTTAIFQDAERELETSQAQEEKISPVRRAWWQLNAVQDAMSRWQAAMDVLNTRADEEIEYQNQWLREQAKASAADGNVSSDGFMAEKFSRGGLFSRNSDEQELIAQAATG